MRLAHCVAEGRSDASHSHMARSRGNQQMALSFPTYFIESALKATGWPRKRWLFGRPVVSGDVCSIAWTEMARASVGIGVGRPILACQLLTHLFGSRDWESSSGDESLADLDDDLAPQHAAHPWRAIVHTEVQEFGSRKYFLVSDLFADEALILQSFRCGQALSYGLLHPREAEAALDEERSAQNAGVAGAIRHGLFIPSTSAWPDNHFYFDWLGEILQAYEARNGLLPPSQPSLISSQVMRERLNS
jgi:hypothetical protein